MFFDDDFAYGRDIWGSGPGTLENLLGGPSLFDAGEIVIVGRVPGALYVDDFAEFQTGLEHIMPLEAAQGAINIITADAGDVPEDVETPGEAPSSGDGDEDPGEDAPAALIALIARTSEKAEEPLILPSKDDLKPQVLISQDDGEPLVLIAQDDGEPLADLFGFDPGDFGRPDILDTVPPVVTATAPGSTQGDPAPAFSSGRAFQSLAFLILDTPYVVGDEFLPITVRPSLNELLGLPDGDEEQAPAWVLPPRGQGAWRLG